MSKFQNDSIFWIEVDKIKPNPYQPRKEFNEDKLGHLAESIRQYGILQPIVVTRHEISKEDGGLVVEYELIAGERRLRASKIAGLTQIPSIIRTEEEDDSVKLELAIIENLQREDLNPIDRAVAFQQLVEEFGLKHAEVAKKVGKSREYVTNTLRLLALPEEMKRAIVAGQITEGHSRPILMLRDKPEEQATLYKEIIHRRLTVRDAEAIARKIAVDKVRKKEYVTDPEILELEGQLAESLGTRVQIEKKEVGGKLMIDFFSNDDLKKILELIQSNEKKNPNEMLDNYINNNNIIEEIPNSINNQDKEEKLETNPINNMEEQDKDENNIISIGENFTPNNSTENNQQESPEQLTAPQAPKKIEDVMSLGDGIEIIKSDEPVGGGIDISKENDNISNISENENTKTPIDNLSGIDNIGNMGQKEINVVDSIDTKGGDLPTEEAGDIYTVKDFNI